MQRSYLRQLKSIDSDGSIHCRRCTNQVACVRNCIRTGWQGGIFKRVFNVHVAYNYDFHLEQFGATVAQTFCIRCGKLIGWKILGISRRGEDLFLRAGRFLMLLHKLSTLSGEPLLRLNQLQRANEENADDDADTADEDGNEADQDGDENEQNVDQDGVCNEENADQDGGGNEQNANQDGGNNEQPHDQDGGNNEQPHDQDGGKPMN